MKRILDFINRLWNVCSQMEIGAFLTCGSGIKVVNVDIIFYLIIFYILKIRTGKSMVAPVGVCKKFKLDT